MLCLKGIDLKNETIVRRVKDEKRWTYFSRSCISDCFDIYDSPRQRTGWYYSSSMSVERLASRMERFMKMHVEVVRNQMELNTSLRKLISLQIDNAKNGRFAHISDSTYFDTRTAEIFRRPAP